MRKCLRDIDNDWRRDLDVSRFISLSSEKFSIPEVEVTTDKMWSRLSIGVGEQQKLELLSQPFFTLKEFDDGSLIYRSIDSGLCEFFATCPIERGGFGGRVHKFQMADGRTMKCGAWSSNSGAINEYLFDHQIMGINTIVKGGFKTWGYALDVGVAHYALVHWGMNNLDSARVEAGEDRYPYIAEVPMFKDGSRNWNIVWYDNALRCYWDRFEGGKRLDASELTFAVGSPWD